MRARAFWDGRAFAAVVGSGGLDGALVLVVDGVIGGSGIRRVLSDLVGEARGSSLFGGMHRHGGGGNAGSELLALLGFCVRVCS
jgi:hypothetical protein